MKEWILKYKKSNLKDICNQFLFYSIHLQFTNVNYYSIVETLIRILEELLNGETIDKN